MSTEIDCAHPSAVKMNHQTTNKKDNVNVLFYVTGFGKFGNITENPTTTLVHELEQQQKGILPVASVIGEDSTQSSVTNVTSDEGNATAAIEVSSSSLSSDSSIQISQCKIIKTAASNVKTEIQELMKTIQQETNNITTTDTTNIQQNIVCLHLGVNYKGKNFLLESTAFNDASFRIPDEDGYQPKKEPIDECMSFGERLTTSLNVKKICTKMEEKGFDVSVSGDAGRFVCNYLYWTSLNHIRMQQLQQTTGESDDGNGDGSKSTIHSLFVHVPLFTVIDQETQFNFVQELMVTIKEVLLTTKKKKKRSKAKC